MDIQTEHGVAGKLLMLTVLAVIGLSAALPVIQQAVENAGVEGSTATVLGLLPLFLGLVLLLALAEPVLERVQ